MQEEFCIALWDQLRERAYRLGASLDGLFDTPEHFRMTEERLGFPLPTYLRDLFLRVAHGGEPYHGHRPMYSLTGGHPSAPDMDALLSSTWETIPSSRIGSPLWRERAGMISRVQSRRSCARITCGLPSAVRDNRCWG